jgi:hypothetical protein
VARLLNRFLWSRLFARVRAAGGTAGLKSMQEGSGMRVSFCLLAAMGCLMFADSLDERTVVTFHSPVEIPGQVLAAGTYVFKVPLNPLDRDVIEIFNASESQLIATEWTVPVTLDNPPGHPVFAMRETGAGDPPQLREFDYPGMTSGHQFVYGPEGR